MVASLLLHPFVRNLLVAESMELPGGVGDNRSSEPWGPTYHCVQVHLPTSVRIQCWDGASPCLDMRSLADSRGKTPHCLAVSRRHADVAALLDLQVRAGEQGGGGGGGGGGGSGGGGRQEGGRVMGGVTWLLLLTQPVMLPKHRCRCSGGSRAWMCPPPSAAPSHRQGPAHWCRRPLAAVRQLLGPAWLLHDASLGADDAAQAAGPRPLTRRPAGVGTRPQEAMHDPVVAADGFTYERTAM